MNASAEVKLREIKEHITLSIRHFHIDHNAPYFPPKILHIFSWDRLFKGRLALNPGLNLTPVSFFLCSKVFSRIIFSVIFRASNHQLVDKKN